MGKSRKEPEEEAKQLEEKLIEENIESTRDVFTWKGAILFVVGLIVFSLISSAVENNKGIFSPEGFLGAVLPYAFIIVLVKIFGSPMVKFECDIKRTEEE